MKYTLKEHQSDNTKSFKLGVSWREVDGNQASNPFCEESQDYIGFLAGFWSKNQTNRYKKLLTEEKK